MPAIKFALGIVFLVLAWQNNARGGAADAPKAVKATPLRVLSVKDKEVIYRNYRCSFSADGKLIAAEDKVWEVDTGKETDTLQGAPNRCRLWAFCPDGKNVALVSVDARYAVRLWDRASVRNW
jgi:WD40 repeat protein